MALLTSLVSRSVSSKERPVVSEGFILFACIDLDSNKPTKEESSTIGNPDDPFSGRCDLFSRCHQGNNDWTYIGFIFSAFLVLCLIVSNIFIFKNIIAIDSSISYLSNEEE